MGPSTPARTLQSGLAACVLAFVLVSVPAAAFPTCEPGGDAGSTAATSQNLSSAVDPLFCTGSLTPGSDIVDWYRFELTIYPVPDHFHARVCSTSGAYAFNVQLHVRTPLNNGPVQVSEKFGPRGGCVAFDLDDVGNTLDFLPGTTVYLRMVQGDCNPCDQVKSYNLEADRDYTGA